MYLKYLLFETFLSECCHDTFAVRVLFGTEMFMREIAVTEKQSSEVFGKRIDTKCLGRICLHSYY